MNFVSPFRAALGKGQTGAETEIIVQQSGSTVQDVWASIRVMEGVTAGNSAKQHEPNPEKCNG